VVRGSTLDTMFYVLSPGGNGNTTLQVDTSDSNGHCATFQWDLDADGTINATTTTTTTWVQGFLANQARLARVLTKDDDSIMSRSLTFYVYPDAPPPPATTTPSDALPGVRKISWKKMDVKDSLATQFQILVHKEGVGGYDDPIEGNPADLASDWKAGSQYEAGMNDYTCGYTYTPTLGTGTYFYMVISRDARGSKAYSLVGSFGF